MIINILKHKTTFFSEIPQSPGCYIYRDSSNKILYVGKAIDIRKRVRQYFDVIDNKLFPNFKIEQNKKLMISKVRSVEYVTTDSEVEALILETNLIKKYKPRFNRLMVDDKNYGWVKVTDYEDFPRITYVREKKDKKATYFGPFPNTFPAKLTIKNLRKLFPYATCKRDMREELVDGKLTVICSDPKPCLYYHLGLCDAPCANLQTKSEYRRNISNIKKYLRGEKQDVVKDLENRMYELSKNQSYEEAEFYKQMIERLKYVTQRIKVNEDIDEKKWAEYKEKRKLDSIDNLKLNLRERMIIDPDNNLRRIECYDISNIQGKQAVGSMVVFIGGDRAKAHYRKFKIKVKDTPDDFEMMKEVIRRRFGKSEDGKQDLSFDDSPNLIIIDGGKGQLSSVLEVAEELKLNLPIVGLAKKEEIIFWHDGERFRSYKLGDKSEEKFLVQRIRDEAHRFAITYHRKLRSKHQLVSRLDQVPGIGPKTKVKLLNEFKTVKAVERAGRNQLMKVVGNRRIVENILKYL